MLMYFLEKSGSQSVLFFLKNGLFQVVLRFSLFFLFLLLLLQLLVSLETLVLTTAAVVSETRVRERRS